MALQILKSFMVLLAVLLPPLIARIIFRRQFREWFAVNDDSFFSLGFPMTLEGYGLSIAIIIIVVIALMTVTNYF